MSAELEPGEDWEAALGVLPLPDAQPSHAEILARLAAMRPASAVTPTQHESFEQVHARVMASQEALPVQHCAVCGTAFRHQRAGLCWGCMSRRRRGT